MTRKRIVVGDDEPVGEGRTFLDEELLDGRLGWGDNATLEHHARGVPRRAQPEHVAIPERSRPRHAIVVDEDPPGAAGVSHLRAGGVEAHPRVERAHAGEVQLEVADGGRADQNLRKGRVEGEALAVQRAAEDRERRDRTGGIGHRRVDRILGSPQGSVKVAPP